MTPEVLVALITAGFGFLGLVAVELLRRQRNTDEKVSEVREHVANTHSTNLRDDLDLMHDDVKTLLKMAEQQRDELILERKERIALAARLDEHIASAAA